MTDKLELEKKLEKVLNQFGDNFLFLFGAYNYKDSQ